MRWQGSDLPPYPVEPIRDRYVSPFAGVSYDLSPFEIGVNAAALQANTSLSAKAEVLVGIAESKPNVRALARGMYRVVPLDEARPDALRLSPRGEVVFSTFQSDLDPSLVPWLRRGDAIVLNASLARFPIELRRPGEAI